MKNKQPYLYLFLGLITLFGVTGIADFGNFGNYCGILMRIWSLFHLYFITRHGYLNGPLKYLTLFLLLLIVYSVIPSFYGQIYYYTDSYGNTSTMTAFNYMNVSWMYACPVYSFYWFTKRNYIDKKFITFLTVVGFCYAILFLIQENIVYAKIAYGNDYGHTNNAAYIFLHLFPLLFYFKEKPTVQYVLLLIILIAIVICVKRGAIIIAFICLPFFLKENLKLSSKNRFSLIFFSFIFLILIALIIGYEYQHNTYLNEKIDSMFKGDSSRRDEYYSMLWNYYINKFDTYDQLFGIGIYGSLTAIGDYAHNDWLEYLISFGFVGIFAYALYMFSLVKLYIKNRSLNYDVTNSFFLTIIILFMSSFFSMSYTGMTIFIAFSIGYSMCRLESRCIYR